ncbi:hypothetical protein BJ508DRAFT_58459 [Ascobolus immersus RN42]|uniref:Telomeric single stranded DNA binding POT1/Cdc13 domain-containing protein n=1 Tax=Ascobolus immersus RN42 TaxID=1160509 RepID=A0A3N4HFG5_ASCIM|nr:hypothetical protein BJ508DRAFT_58459 [Ascobolus immersus RN42]
MAFSQPPIPIASLNPSLTTNSSPSTARTSQARSSPFFTGTICLLYPYRTSPTPSITFLLRTISPAIAQVRVRFTHRLAWEVKKSGAHIGDELSVSLEGVRWEEEEEGKKGGRWVGWIVEVGGSGGKVQIRKKDNTTMTVEVRAENAELERPEPTTVLPSLRERSRSTTVASTPEISTVPREQTPSPTLPLPPAQTPKPNPGKRTWMETDLDAILFDELNSDDEVERKPKKARYSLGTNWRVDEVVVEKEEQREPQKRVKREPVVLGPLSPHVGDVGQGELKAETPDTEMGEVQEEDKQEEQTESQQEPMPQGRRPSIIATVTTTVDQVETHIPEAVPEAEEEEEHELAKAEIETTITAEHEQKEDEEMGGTDDASVDGRLEDKEGRETASDESTKEINAARKESEHPRNPSPKPATASKVKNEPVKSNMLGLFGTPAPSIKPESSSNMHSLFGTPTPGPAIKPEPPSNMLGLFGATTRRPSIPTEPDSPQLRPADSPKTLMSPFISGSLDGTTPTATSNAAGAAENSSHSLGWSFGGARQTVPPVPSNLSRLENAEEAEVKEEEREVKDEKEVGISWGFGAERKEASTGREVSPKKEKSPSVEPKREEAPQPERSVEARQERVKQESPEPIEIDEPVKEEEAELIEEDDESIKQEDTEPIEEDDETVKQESPQPIEIKEDTEPIEEDAPVKQEEVEPIEIEEDTKPVKQEDVEPIEEDDESVKQEDAEPIEEDTEPIQLAAPVKQESPQPDTPRSTCSAPIDLTGSSDEEDAADSEDDAEGSEDEEEDGEGSEEEDAEYDHAADEDENNASSDYDEEGESEEEVEAKSKAELFEIAARQLKQSSPVKPDPSPTRATPARRRLIPSPTPSPLPTRSRTATQSPAKTSPSKNLTVSKGIVNVKKETSPEPERVSKPRISLFGETPVKKEPKGPTGLFGPLVSTKKSDSNPPRSPSVGKNSISLFGPEPQTEVKKEDEGIGGLFGPIVGEKRKGLFGTSPGKKRDTKVTPTGPSPRKTVGVSLFGNSPVRNSQAAKAGKDKSPERVSKPTISLFGSPPVRRPSAEKLKSPERPPKPAARETHKSPQKGHEEREYKLNAFFNPLTGPLSPTRSRIQKANLTIETSPKTPREPASQQSRRSHSHASSSPTASQAGSQASSTVSPGMEKLLAGARPTDLSPEEREEIFMKYAPPVKKSGSRMSSRSLEGSSPVAEPRTERAGKRRKTEETPKRTSASLEATSPTSLKSPKDMSPREREEVLVKYGITRSSGKDKQGTPTTRRPSRTLTAETTPTSTAPTTPVKPSSSSSLLIPNTPTKALHNFTSGLTTPLSDYPAIATLTYNQAPDILALVTRAATPVRSTKGAKDWCLSFRCLDSSSLKGIAVNLFRRSKDDLPEFTFEEGKVNAVLLRGCKVESEKRELRLVGNARTAGWVVWRGLTVEMCQEGQGEGEGKDGKGMKAEVGRVPVEYGKEEEAYGGGCLRLSV